MNTASEVWTYYTTAPLDLPKQWNWGREHFRIVLRNRRFLKLNKFRNRLGVEDLGYFCPKYAPVHVYFSVLDRRFPERVGRKYKASYALPASGEYVVDVYSLRARQRKNVGEDWINEGYRKPKISDVFIVEIGCFEHGEISWFLKPYRSKSERRSRTA